jgi:DNA invertase Pin-like site-specific DNA recombinase
MDFVSYYRVSTRKQGASGLGLDAQKAAVRAFVKSQDGHVVRSFKEVESGKKSDDERPELRKALAHAKRSGATVVVAKLDRLSRNVNFLSALMESGADFVCVDNPTATRLTLHVLAAVAEWEAQAISERTKAGLAEAKRRGVKLGSARPGHWDGREEARLRGLAAGRVKAAATISRKFREGYSDLIPEITTMREEGLSLQKIADRLNGDGHRTRRNAEFSKVQVSRILKVGVV